MPPQIASLVRPFLPTVGFHGRNDKNHLPNYILEPLFFMHHAVRSFYPNPRSPHTDLSWTQMVDKVWVRLATQTPVKFLVV